MNSILLSLHTVVKFFVNYQNFCYCELSCSASSYCLALDFLLAYKFDYSWYIFYHGRLTYQALGYEFQYQSRN